MNTLLDPTPKHAFLQYVDDSQRTRVWAQKDTFLYKWILRIGWFLGANLLWISLELQNSRARFHRTIFPLYAMNVLLLARIQYALTIGFHYLYVPLSMGLSLLLVLLEGLYLKTNDELYRVMAKFWMRIFAITFALGVATGLIMNFEFGTNWAVYSRYVGDIFGSALVVEGLFAFFLESAFLGVLLFGWDRVTRSVHFFSTCMVCLGAHLSAVWIVIVNSWMHTPAGFRIVGEGLDARAEITNFWEMCLNPSALDRIAHTTFAAWLYAAFLVIAVCAWYLKKGRDIHLAERCLKVALYFACVCLGLQLVTGHMSAIRVGEYQPPKMAAFEGLFTTKGYAPMYGFGLVNAKDKKVRGVALPAMLSVLLHGKPSAQVIGLDSVPEDEWPPLQITFQAYHLMIATWGLMATLAAWTLWRIRGGKLQSSRILLFTLPYTVVIPCLGNLAGWFCAEVGRQPWVVWKQLRTCQALSESVTANMVLDSIILFGILYILTFALFLYLVMRKVREGPGNTLQSAEYQQPFIHIAQR